MIDILTGKECKNMKIIINQMINITIDDDNLISWSHDEYTGIYTLVLIDQTVWTYESKTKKFYKDV